MARMGWFALLALLPACLGSGGSGGGGGFGGPLGDGLAFDATASGADGAQTPETTAVDADAKASSDTAPKDAAGTDGAAKDSGAPVASGATAPNCIDGQYAETLPSTTGDIAALKAGYTPAGANAFVLDVLKVRYPFGVVLIQTALKKQDCIAMFLNGNNLKTASGAMSMLSTLVHECGHLADLGAGGFDTSTYIIQSGVKMSCSGASHNGANQGFARSLLQKDEYAKLRPACPAKGPNGCDSYASVYLDGDPNDGKFQGGDQAFSSVMEETTQYVNSLVTDYAFGDQSQFSISSRDGILTFLWYTERYLHMARLQFPEVHAYILGQPCWRQLILTVWGRAWLYLETTKTNQKLTIDGAKILPLVMDADLLAEIELVRKAQGCTPAP